MEKRDSCSCILNGYWYRMLVDAKIYEQMKTGNDFEELKALD